MKLQAQLCKLYVVDYTENFLGKDYWRRQEVYARDLEHAADIWDNMCLSHQQTESITHSPD